MDTRTKNRLREHSGDEHKLSRANERTANVNRAPEVVFVCECGWRGWLDRVAVDGKDVEVA